MKKIIFFTFLWYALVIFQTSFFAHFSFWGVTPNIFILGVLFLNLFESADSSGGIIAACAAGFFLDIFSSPFFGMWIFILAIGSLLIKFFKRTYVRVPLY